MKRLLVVFACFCCSLRLIAQQDLKQETYTFLKSVLNETFKGKSYYYIMHTPLDLNIFFADGIRLDSQSCIKAEKIKFDTLSLREYNTTFQFSIPDKFMLIDTTKLFNIKQQLIVPVSKKGTVEVKTRIDQSYVVSIAKPVFSTDKNFVLFYFSSITGGNGGSTELNIYQRKGNKWKFYCSLYHDLR